MKHQYGHRPPEISARELGLGWITGIRRIVRSSASSSTWHRHEETSIICCLKGEMAYEFHGLEPITLTAGSFLTIPALAEHRHLGAIDPIGERLELLLAPNAQKPRYALFSPAVSRQLHTKLLKCALQPVRFSGNSAHALRTLYSLAGTAAPARDDELLGLIRVLCHQLLYDFAAPLSPATEKADPHIIESIVDWFDQHFAEKIDIDRIVARVGYSRTHVFTLFKKQFGLTPADYLKRLRIRKAQALLTTTNFSAHEIALQCGFKSDSVFGQTFRKLIGTTPTDYRAHTATCR